jgi:SpoVK/Ycf46/Vps4 family AAA+-type ATPase
LQVSNIVRAEVGTSEKKLVSAFEIARSNAPSVVFIDEFQALFTERTGSGSGKLASTLLQCMDDLTKWNSVDEIAEATDSGNGKRGRIVVLGATNAPWLVDKAFLRAGRFDRVVHVGLPTVSERASILRVHIHKMRIRRDLDDGRSDFIDRLCTCLASVTEGFSGADLAALCRTAAVRCLSECGEQGEIEEQHFLKSLDNLAASNSQELVNRLLDWRP